MRRRLFTTLAVIFFSLPLVSFGGNSVQSGGDIFAMEFTNIARATIQHLTKSKMNKGLTRVVKRLKTNVDRVRVTSTDELYLKGEEVDAKNTPDQFLIQINSRRWNERRYSSLNLKMRFVLHEYLGVSRIEDASYFVSQQLVDILAPETIENVILRNQMVAQIEQIKYYTFWHDLQSGSEVAQLMPYCMSLGANIYRMAEIKNLLNKHKDWVTSTAALENALIRIEVSLAELTSMCHRQEVNYKIIKDQSEIMFEELSSLSSHP